MDWATLPPIQRSIGPIHLTAPPAFNDRLATRKGPKLALAPLGHHVAAEAPSGIVLSLLAPVAKRDGPELVQRLRVQRRIDGAPRALSEDIDQPGAQESEFSMTAVDPSTSSPSLSPAWQLPVVAAEAQVPLTASRLTEVGNTELTPTAGLFSEHLIRITAPETSESVLSPATLPPARLTLGQARRLGLGPPISRVPHAAIQRDPLGEDVPGTAASEPPMPVEPLEALTAAANATSSEVPIPEETPPGAAANASAGQLPLARAVSTPTPEGPDLPPLPPVPASRDPEPPSATVAREEASIPTSPLPKSWSPLEDLAIQRTTEPAPGGPTLVWSTPPLTRDRVPAVQTDPDPPALPPDSAMPLATSVSLISEPAPLPTRRLVESRPLPEGAALQGSAAPAALRELTVPGGPVPSVTGSKRDSLRPKYEAASAEVAGAPPRPPAAATGPTAADDRGLTGTMPAVAPLVGSTQLLLRHSLQRSPDSVPAPMQQAMSRSLGVDLSDTRIHRGDGADLLAEDFFARAFTQSEEVYLPSKHGPIDRGTGGALLAHELTHVAQQHRLGPNLPAESSPLGRTLEADAQIFERAWQRSSELALASGGAPPRTLQTATTSSGVVANDVADQGTVGGLGTQKFDSSPLFTTTPHEAPSSSYLSLTPESGPLQRAEASPASVVEPAAAPMAGSVATKDMDELARKLYDRIRSRLRTELLVDRERAGLLTDLR